jgi:hypothetical protein
MEVAGEAGRVALGVVLLAILATFQSPQASPRSFVSGPASSFADPWVSWEVLVSVQVSKSSAHAIRLGEYMVCRKRNDKDAGKVRVRVYRQGLDGRCFGGV